MGNRSRGQTILKIPARKRRFSMAKGHVTASEFQDHVGEPFDRSLSQPVVIAKHGRPRNVVLSYGEYERLSARDRRAARVEDLSDDKLAAIGASEMEHGFEHFNAELEEQRSGSL
jgi:prevent-host-death family protein